VGDAHLELGNYEQAEKTYQEVERKDQTIYLQSRRARLAELKGQPDKAVQLMQQAAAEEGERALSKESKAWYQVRLGDVHFNAGRLEKAAEHYEAARKQASHLAPALAGLGQVRAAQGRYDEAIALYQ